MKKNAYSALAEVYEKLINSEDYEKWSDYFVNEVKSFARGKKGVDFACGSGYFTRALKSAGFDVIGVDLSEEMLTEAVNITAKEKLNVRYFKGDMTTFKPFEKVDFISVINDGINYLSHEKLERAFKNFYSALNVGGVLFFDFSTEYKLKNIIGNNLFGEDTEDCSYLWFNELKEDRVLMQLSIFTRKGDVFLKKEEEQIQYIYSLENIIKMLKKCGYKSIITQNHLGGEIKEDCLRIEIVAKKERA